MSESKTHRLRNSPSISVRDLADYMAASETAKRTIVRDSKFQSRARVLQHDEARSAISKFIREGSQDIGWLQAQVNRLRDRLSDSPFERDALDHNADYIERFAEVLSAMPPLPGTPIAAGAAPPITLNGVRVTMDLHIRLRRMTRTNKAKVGGVMLRYAKGETLPDLVGEWQSAFLFGYLRATGEASEGEPDQQLCVTLDAYRGTWHAAPTNSVSRFNNMKSACASIAERWPNVPPPPNAVF
jgi:hypothetical protein